MMIAIISDVHGNYPALKAVLQKIDDLGCDEILSLGDVAGYYCMVNECIDEFRRRRIINLLGNHDSYLLGLSKCPRSTTVNNCIEYQKNIISNTNFEYLKSSCLTFDNCFLSARHGGWKDPVDEYIDVFDFSLVKSSNKELFCSGHTHIQKIQKSDIKTYFNPGSVGQPRDGNPKAAFAVINDGTVELHRTEYDIDEISSKMKAEGFEDRIFDCLRFGLRIQTFGS